MAMKSANIFEMVENMNLFLSWHKIVQNRTQWNKKS